MSCVNVSSLVPEQWDNLCVNTIRCLSVDALEKADSGPPGLPRGAAPLAALMEQEDASTNLPTEQPAWLRVIPNLLIIQ